MAKAKFERTKPHCNIGTIGHVDLGNCCSQSGFTMVYMGDDRHVTNIFSFDFHKQFPFYAYKEPVKRAFPTIQVYHIFFRLQGKKNFFSKSGSK